MEVQQRGYTCEFHAFPEFSYAREEEEGEDEEDEG